MSYWTPQHQTTPSSFDRSAGLTEAIASLPAPFLLLGIVGALLAVLLWKFVVSAAMGALALWAVATHGGNALVVLLALALALSAVALLLSTGPRSARLRLHREEVAR